MSEKERLRASVMESDGRWKDLSARYDALFAELRTATAEIKQLQGEVAAALRDMGDLPDCPDERSGYDDADGWSSLEARSADYERGFEDGCAAPCPGCAKAREVLERLECQCSYVSERSGCHAWAQQLLEQIRNALAAMDAAKGGSGDGTDHDERLQLSAH